MRLKSFWTMATRLPRVMETDGEDDQGHGEVIAGAGARTARRSSRATAAALEAVAMKVVT